MSSSESRNIRSIHKNQLHFRIITMNMLKPKLKTILQSFLRNEILRYILNKTDLYAKSYKMADELNFKSGETYSVCALKDST